TFTAILGAHDYFLDSSEHLRIANFFAQFFEKRMNLRKHDEHFPAYGGLEEQICTQRAVQHERRGHAPIAAHLAQPIVLLRPRSKRDLHEVVGASRPES